MSNEPVTWFHGLMAERTAEFSPNATQVPFLRREIGHYGQPVLDLGCGTGRLLVPLLADGFDVDGSDVSGDMLQHCRDTAAAQGLTPNLYEQPMHTLTLPRAYRTIYICASFNLAGTRRQGLQALGRCYAHLEDGGALLLDIDAEYAYPEDWANWEPSNQSALPESWPEKGNRRVSADGGEYVERHRTLSVDPLEQRMIQQVRIEKWLAGELLEAQEYDQHRTLYLPNELRLMLETVGFRETTIRDGYTNHSATPHSKQLLFTAIR